MKTQWLFRRERPRDLGGRQLMEGLCPNESATVVNHAGWSGCAGAFKSCSDLRCSARFIEVTGHLENEVGPILRALVECWYFGRMTFPTSSVQAFAISRRLELAETMSFW